MSKKITVKNKYFTAYADVAFIDGNGAMGVEPYVGEWFTTASKREISKTIRTFYSGNDCEVLAIRNIRTETVYTTHTYKIEASNDEIVQACIQCGLTVNEVFDSEDHAESEDA